jgi:hypothetical protein
MPSDLSITPQSLVEENKRRKSAMLDGYDPLTGEGCWGERIKLVMPDFPYPVMYVPKEVYDNPLVQCIRDCGSVERFVRLHYQGEDEDLMIEATLKNLIIARADEDPEFAFVIFFFIQDKVSGEMVPFRLNYPQRLLLAEFETMRHAGEPIRLVVLKARQWGGSTLTQLYMAWIQIFKRVGWYSVILAQTKDTSKRIKAMYTKVLGRMEPWAIDSDKPVMFAPYEKSSSDSILMHPDGTVARNNVVSIASYENYDSVRGNSYSMAHYSEVAFWKDTDGKSPEEVISSVSGGILERPYTMEVLESSARGAAGYFYDECQLAMAGKSNRRFLFIPFYYIEHDTIEVRQQKAFAKWLLACKDMEDAPKGCADAGKYYWRMWTLGATFEHIKWYARKRLTFHSHANMATEAPIDPVEAFKSTGNLLFNPYRLDEMEKDYAREPIYIGELRGAASKGKAALTHLTFCPDEAGKLQVWAMPVPTDRVRMERRYVVSVDVGGRSREADYSVITVIDRMALALGERGRIKVVARWRGHVRHDYLAWMAAQIATWYNKALLIFEKNTYESEKERNTDGEHVEYILDEVADFYPNMYFTLKQGTEISEPHARTWGFHTNRQTKPKLIDNLVTMVEDDLWEDPDKEMYHELRIYEKRDDNSFGNIKGKGNHDDVLMSTAIGLYVSTYEMDAPAFVRDKQRQHTDTVATEARF